MKLEATSDRIDLPNGFHLTVIDEPDAPSLVKYLNEPEFSHHTLSIPHPYTDESAQWFISHVMAWEKESGIQKDWALREPGGEMVGSIGLLYDYGIESHRSGMGYWLAKPYWNQGLMTTTIQIFSDNMFASRPLLRLEACVFDFNPASSRCLEKAGFQYEGVIAGSHLKHGHLYDTHQWAKVRRPH